MIACNFVLYQCVKEIKNIEQHWNFLSNIIPANAQSQKLRLLKWKIRNMRPKIGTKTYSVYLNAIY